MRGERQKILAGPSNSFLSYQSARPYCGGAVVDGAVDDGGGVVAVGPGVTVSGFAEGELFGDFVLLRFLLVRD